MMCDMITHMAQPISGSTLEDYKKFFWIIPLIIGVGLLIVGYAFYQIEIKQAAKPEPSGAAVVDFESCAAAGNPVMESYPRQCRANGTTYVEVIAEPIVPPSEENVFCTADAKQCPDGSYVGRVAPNCEFTPCPGE